MSFRQREKSNVIEETEEREIWEVVSHSRYCILRAMCQHVEEYLGWAVTEYCSLFWESHSGCRAYNINCIVSSHLMPLIGPMTLSKMTHNGISFRLTDINKS